MPRGLNELTMTELATAAPPDTLAAALSPHQLALAYHGRLALAFAPIALALFALALRTRGGVVATGLAVVCCAVYLGFYGRMFDAPDVMVYGLSPGVVAWLPNVVLIALSLSSNLLQRR